MSRIFTIGATVAITIALALAGAEAQGTCINGYVWVQNATSTAWSGRESHFNVVHNGTLYVGGGFWEDGNPVWKPDVYASTDGVTFTQKVAVAPWYGASHTTVSYNGKIWTFGAQSVHNLADKVYTSTDGATWTDVTALYGYPGSAGTLTLLSVVVQPVKNVVVAIFTGAGVTYVMTFDGSRWYGNGTDAVAAPFVVSDALSALPSGLLIASGGGSSGVWASYDAKSWSQISAAAPARGAFGHTVFNDQIVIYGGGDASGRVSGTYSSTQSVSWVQSTGPQPSNPARRFPGLVSFRGVLFLNGGTYASNGHPVPLNDVWTAASRC